MSQFDPLANADRSSEINESTDTPSTINTNNTLTPNNLNEHQGSPINPDPASFDPSQGDVTPGYIYPGSTGQPTSDFPPYTYKDSHNNPQRDHHLLSNPHVSYATALATGDIDDDGNLHSHIKPTSRSSLYHKKNHHSVAPNAILTPYLTSSASVSGMPPHPSLFPSHFSLEDASDDDVSLDDQHGCSIHAEDAGGSGTVVYPSVMVTGDGAMFPLEAPNGTIPEVAMVLPGHGPLVHDSSFDHSATTSTGSPYGHGAIDSGMMRRLSSTSSASASSSCLSSFPSGQAPQVLFTGTTGRSVTDSAKKSMKRVVSIPRSMDASGSFYVPDYYRRLTNNARTGPIRNIIHSRPLQFTPPEIVEQQKGSKKYYQTAEELAADEVKAGIEAMTKQVPKPIPTFTRCHFNTNWIPVDIDDLDSNPLAFTIFSDEQKRANIDDRFDQEKRDISFKYINCLRLRREFVWAPSIYDRRCYEIHQQPPTYAPCLDTESIERIDRSEYRGAESFRPSLQQDLLKNAQNYIFGFVDGVVHVYPKSVLDDLQAYTTDRGFSSTWLPDAEKDPLVAQFKGYSPLVANYGLLLLREQRSKQQKLIQNGGASGNGSPASFFSSTQPSQKNDAQTVAASNNGTQSIPSSRTTVLTSDAGQQYGEKPRSANDHDQKSSKKSKQQQFQLPESDEKNVTPVPTWHDFCDALTYLLTVATDGPCKTWSHGRLSLLEIQKNIHTQMNHSLELSQSKAVPHRDFYNVRKVDNHVHHSACMNQKHLLRFIKKKLREPEADSRKIIDRDGAELTLNEVFRSLNLTSYDLSIDTLDMHATQTFHRFDKFNLKYNPIGESRLREIFLKYNNKIKGEYLAEVTKEVLHDLEANKYQFAEYRMSIYGKEITEWDALADWIIDFQLISGNVRWMIQIPRLYGVYKRSKCINTLQDMLNNIFIPLFAVTLHPESNPKLHQLLSLIVGFDTVDDESVRTKFFDRNDPPPAEWKSNEDPHYCAFMYYLYANLHALNQLRELLHLNTFELRPHAGEAGDIEHVAAAFLCARGINHGLTLFKCPPLQYLYYLSQTGISMSPLSNNLLFLEYQKNPFPKFFSRGLNVTLSTDDPLMIHVTKEPLVEEYSVASQVWKLSHIDLCEIARNSVLQSGFEHRYKVHWLGNRFWKRNVEGNDIRCTNVPDIRIQYRWELLYSEHLLLTHYAYNSSVIDSGLIDPLY